VLPGIDDDGITLTFDRQLALAREEVQLMSFDHPLVRDLFELLTSSHHGNATVARLANPRLPTGTWLLDLQLVIRAQAPASSQIGRFLPPTTVRLLLDAQGCDLSANVALDKLAAQWRPLEARLVRALLKAHGSAVSALVQQAPAIASARCAAIIDAACQQMESTLCSEIDRLEALSAVNPAVRPSEMAALRQQRQLLREALPRAEVQVDSLCLMVVGLDPAGR
jgi:ATP-dependent helicase HepA